MSSTPKSPPDTSRSAPPRPSSRAGGTPFAPERRFGDRWTDDPPPRLCLEPADPQAHRGELRLDQDRRGPRPAETARGGADRMGIHVRRRSLQSCPPAQATGGGHRMTLQDHPPFALPRSSTRPSSTTNGDEAVIKSGYDLRSSTAC